jgi:hypothetical protein
MDKTFDIISFRRLAVITRPDVSKWDLQRFQREGNIQVAFVKGSYEPCSKEDMRHNCDDLNGKVFEIKALLLLDSPLYRISHPNCRCKFVPVPSSMVKK